MYGFIAPNSSKNLPLGAFWADFAPNGGIFAPLGALLSDVHMTLLSKIRLSAKYGGSVYLVSAIVTLSAAVMVIASRPLLPVGVIIKLISIPLIFILLNSMARQQDMYFWLNLGISRIEYYAIPYAVDLAAFVILMIISCAIGNAI